MPLPRVAIVGRPNVGKSSIMNMMAKDKVSIVDPTAGTTRDRVSSVVTLEPPAMATREEREGGGIEPLRIELTDTGGFGVYTEEGRRFNEVGADLARLTDDIEFQISQAVAGADVVLFVIDAQQGVTPHDEEIARLLRERVIGGRGGRVSGSRDRGSGKGEVKDGGAGAGGEADGGGRPPPPIIMVANKVDGPRWEAHAAEASNLGFGEPFQVSAKNNYRRRDFVDHLYGVVAGLPAGDRADDEAELPDMKLAIVGKRNSGKSSLVNRLAGEERVIVSEIAGTTRDAIDVRFEMDGRTFVAIDTAGVRKKKSFADRIEWFAYDRATRSIDRADVAVLLIDATEPISQVDQSLGTLIARSYKPVLMVVNKWDAVAGQKDAKGRAITPESYEAYLRKELAGLVYAPIAFVSAATGLNVRRTIDLAFQLHQQAMSRVTTGKLNRLVRSILETRGPTSKLGTFAKVYYVAQIAVGPPTIGLVVNKPALFTANYQKFLINQFRENMPYHEVPIKLVIKGRKQHAPGEHFREGMDLTPEGEQAFEEVLREGSGEEEAPPIDDFDGVWAEAFFDEEEGEAEAV